MAQESDVPRTLDEFRGSESVVSPPLEAKALPIQPYNWPLYGETVLVICASKNPDKTIPFKNKFIEEAKPTKVLFLNLKVPERTQQPYHEAGPETGKCRAEDAIQIFLQDHKDFPKLHSIGPTFIAVVESAFWHRDVPKPVDWATISIYNVLTGEVETVASKGVTLNRFFLEQAWTAGFVNGDRNRGMKTAGKALAECIPGIDPQRWHEEASGTPRVELLEDAIKDMHIPWGKGKSS